jgi:DNA-directed RNA polymerase subunit RPC12/RpoP
MNKRKVKCFSIYTNVGKHYNVEIFYPFNGGWANFSLFTCLKCGELFVAEQVNNESSDYLTSILSTSDLSCPKCSSLLKTSMANYPSKFLAPDGRIGGFKAPLHFSSELEIKTIEVWDITHLFSRRINLSDSE